MGKAELGMEFPRLWFWPNRLKRLGIVALVYEFLLSLLQNGSGWVAIANGLMVALAIT